MWFPVGLLIAVLSVSSVSAGPMTLNVMGPLLLGDPADLDCSESTRQWKDFERQLKKAKRSGVQSISIDVWWGLVEPQPGVYNWKYYDRMAELIRRNGLKWVPIFSFHQLGGNVGDVGHVPIPKWIWARDGNSVNSGLMYKSEQGNVCREVVSVWGTDTVMPDYRRFMESFRGHFADYASNIQEINISLGPAGELRFPSYNGHDIGTGYPSRGALQAYSDRARVDFRKSMEKKYGTIETLNREWGFQLSSFAEVAPPDPKILDTHFFPSGEQFTAYGKDFFDWYNDSLVLHGRKMMDLAASVFGQPGSVWGTIELGGKIPGVHWRTGGDRLAELTAGLIRTSYADWRSPLSGYGYAHTLDVFRGTARFNSKNKLVAHFTAIEMDDAEWKWGEQVDSKAKTLTREIGIAARSMGITVKGENALAGELSHEEGWKLIREAMGGIYSGVTLLRLGEIIDDPYREKQLKDLGFWTADTVSSHAARCREYFGSFVFHQNH